MWASGHHRKIGGTEVHIGFDAIPKLERGGVGRAIMTRHKDRVGFHKSGKGNAGTVEFDVPIRRPLDHLGFHALRL